MVFGLGFAQAGDSNRAASAALFLPKIPPSVQYNGQKTILKIEFAKLLW